MTREESKKLIEEMFKETLARINFDDNVCYIDCGQGGLSATLLSLNKNAPYKITFFGYFQGEGGDKESEILVDYILRLREEK